MSSCSEQGTQPILDAVKPYERPEVEFLGYWQAETLIGSLPSGGLESLLELQE